MRSALFLSTTAALLLSGCGQSSESGEGNALTGSQKVEAIASTLQACSYEGKPVTAAASALGGAAPGDCAQAVTRIMGYTGLPANFVVVSGPVDNAAAAILLDDKRIPRRVIAFNPKFMSAAAAQVGGNPWGPISIMAHEIAHHLSGHTIVPGGSRPEIELEADKFSGFVLQKMGAPLADATAMILKVGTDHASPTHPGKQQRAAAIRQGWEESARQAGGQAPAPMQSPVRPSAAPSAIPSTVPAVATPRVLPAPGSIPFKYGRFVIDETGKLDPARVRAIEAQLFALARDTGAEFTILVVGDLKGMSAQDYGWAMMRQLRVGKLDVGNGAVVVVAPRQRQAAAVFGPGFAKEAEFANHDKQLLSWIDNAWPYCDDADGCKQWTDALFGMFNGTLTNARNTKWTIDYPSLEALLAHYKAVNDERLRTKRPFNNATDQPNGNLVRISGRITKPHRDVGGVDARLTGGKLGYTAVGMVTDQGYPITLYVSPRLAPLMPSGKLKTDARYTLVGRLQRTGDKAANQPAALWLFSYDEL